MGKAINQKMNLIKPVMTTENNLNPTISGEPEWTSLHSASSLSVTWRLINCFLKHTYLKPNTVWTFRLWTLSSIFRQYHQDNTNTLLSNSPWLCVEVETEWWPEADTGEEMAWTIISEKSGNGNGSKRRLKRSGEMMKPDLRTRGQRGDPVINRSTLCSAVTHTQFKVENTLLLFVQ